MATINRYSRSSYGNYYSNGRSDENEKQSNYTKTVTKGVGQAMQTNIYSGTKYRLLPDEANKSKSNVFTLIDDSAGKIKNGKAKGAWVFRVDGPHDKSLYNHFNTNPALYPNNKIYQGLNHKPVSKLTYNIAKNANKIAKVSKVGGRALSVVAAVLDGKEIYDSYKQDGNSVGKNTIVTSSGVAGSWIGGAGGAKAGAMGGAAIGTMICPGLGTTIGGIVGGLLGGIAGALGGRVAGEGIANGIIGR